jgi:hypothetical protein
MTTVRAVTAGASSISRRYVPLCLLMLTTSNPCLPMKSDSTGQTLPRDFFGKSAFLPNRFRLTASGLIRCAPEYDLRSASQGFLHLLCDHPRNVIAPTPQQRLAARFFVGGRDECISQSVLQVGDTPAAMDGSLLEWRELRLSGTCRPEGVAGLATKIASWR